MRRYQHELVMLIIFIFIILPFLLGATRRHPTDCQISILRNGDKEIACSNSEHSMIIPLVEICHIWHEKGDWLCVEESGYGSQLLFEHFGKSHKNDFVGKCIGCRLQPRN